MYFHNILMTLKYKYQHKYKYKYKHKYKYKYPQARGGIEQDVLESYCWMYVLYIILYIIIYSILLNIILYIIYYYYIIIYYIIYYYYILYYIIYYYILYYKRRYSTWNIPKEYKGACSGGDQVQKRIFFPSENLKKKMIKIMKKKRVIRKEETYISFHQCQQMGNWI